MRVTEKEYNRLRRITGVVVAGVLIVLVLMAVNIVPSEYNIFHGFSGDDEPTLAVGEGYIEGFPDSVNVTVQENNSYQISIIANESYLSGMELKITMGEDLLNTSAYWTATDTDWQISGDQLTATYVGDPLGVGVTDDNLVLHVDGGEVEDEIDIDITTEVGDITPTTVTIDVLI